MLPVCDVEGRALLCEHSSVNYTIVPTRYPAGSVLGQKKKLARASREREREREREMNNVLSYCRDNTFDTFIRLPLNTCYQTLHGNI